MLGLIKSSQNHVTTIILCTERLKSKKRENVIKKYLFISVVYGCIQKNQELKFLAIIT